MSIGESHSMEELIFDYLEGNLSPEGRSGLEAKMKADPLVRAEVEAWKSSYLLAAPVVFPAAGALLNGGGASSSWMGLLKQAAVWSSTTSKVIVGVLLTSSLVLTYVALKEPASPPKTEEQLILPPEIQEEVISDPEPETDSLREGLLIPDTLVLPSAPPQKKSIKTSKEKSIPDSLVSNEVEEHLPAPGMDSLVLSPVPALSKNLHSELPGREISLDSVWARLKKKEAKTKKTLKAPPLKNEGF